VGSFGFVTPKPRRLSLAATQGGNLKEAHPKLIIVHWAAQMALISGLHATGASQSLSQPLSPCNCGQNHATQSMPLALSKPEDKECRLGHAHFVQSTAS